MTDDSEGRRKRKIKEKSGQREIKEKEGQEKGAGESDNWPVPISRSNQGLTPCLHHVFMSIANQHALIICGRVCILSKSLESLCLVILKS